MFNVEVDNKIVRKDLFVLIHMVCDWEVWFWLFVYYVLINICFEM